MWRQLLIDGIEADPAWAGGEYRAEPVQGLRNAEIRNPTAVRALAVKTGSSA